MCHCVVKLAYLLSSAKCIGKSVESTDTEESAFHIFNDFWLQNLNFVSICWHDASSIASLGGRGADSSIKYRGFPRHWHTLGQGRQRCIWYCLCSPYKHCFLQSKMPCNHGNWSCEKLFLLLLSSCPTAQTNVHPFCIIVSKSTLLQLSWSKRRRKKRTRRKKSDRHDFSLNLVTDNSNHQYWI